MALPPIDTDEHAGIGRLTDLLVVGQDEIVRRVVARLQTAVPSYAAIPPEQLAVEVRASSHMAMAGVRERRLPRAEELELVEALVARRAAEGHPVEDVLAAYRVGMREAWMYALEVAQAHSVPSELVLSATGALWEWADAISTHGALSQREAELRLARRDELQRSDTLRALLTGGVAPAKGRALAVASGLSPDRPWRALRARPSAADADVAAHLERSGCGLVGHLDGDVVALVTDRMDALVGVVAGLGPPGALEELPASYRLASRALSAAETAKLSGAFELADVALAAVVIGEEQIGRLLVQRYIAPLRAEGAFGEDLITTLRALIAHDLRMNETARALHVQPSTLRHRLRRAEQLLGCDLRRLSDLTRVWWALERADLDGS